MLLLQFYTSTPLDRFVCVPLCMHACMCVCVIAPECMQVCMCMCACAWAHAGVCVCVFVCTLSHRSFGCSLVSFTRQLWWCAISPNVYHCHWWKFTQLYQNVTTPNPPSTPTPAHILFSGFSFYVGMCGMLLSHRTYCLLLFCQHHRKAYGEGGDGALHQCMNWI